MLVLALLFDSPVLVPFCSGTVLLLSTVTVTWKEPTPAVPSGSFRLTWRERVSPELMGPFPGVAGLYARVVDATSVFVAVLTIEMLSVHDVLVFPAPVLASSQLI